MAVMSSSATALQFAFTSPASPAGSPAYQDVCWKFRELPGNNPDPFPTDMVRVYDGLYRANNFAEWQVVLKKPLAGEWVQSVDSDQVTVPMVGTMVPVIAEASGQGEKEYVQLQLAGNITDLTFNSDYTYECSINTKLELDTGTSTQDFDQDRPTGRLGYVYAYCVNYFGEYFQAVADGYTPFGPPGLGLQRVECPADEN